MYLNFKSFSYIILKVGRDHAPRAQHSQDINGIEQDGAGRQDTFAHLQLKAYHGHSEYYETRWK